MGCDRADFTPKEISLIIPGPEAAEAETVHQARHLGILRTTGAFLKMTQGGRRSGVRARLTRYGRFSLPSAGFEGTRRSRVPSMFDPRTGGVAQAPKTRCEEWR